MKPNRRFPFEKNQQKISLENFSTTEQQLYPMIRQYASISRSNNDNVEKSERPQQNFLDSNEGNYRLEQLVNYLKQQRDNNFVDVNSLSALRDQNIQHWKQVKYEWQKFYQDKNRKQQELFAHLIKTYRT